MKKFKYSFELTGWPAVAFIVLVATVAFLALVTLAKAQDDDPLLKDVRYWQQIRQSLSQEYRANNLQINALERRQKEIEEAIKVVVQKIKELQAPMDIQPVEPPKVETPTETDE